jgi:hypothetical protein
MLVPEDPDIIANLTQQAAVAGTEAQLVLATALQSHGDQRAALAICWHILQDDPGDIEALHIATRALRDLQQTETALRYAAVIEQLSAVRTMADPQPLTPVVPLTIVRDSATANRISPSVTLADVAGMQAVKRRLYLAFLGPLKYPRLCEAFGKTLRGGLLLWGPAGLRQNVFGQSNRWRARCNVYFGWAGGRAGRVHRRERKKSARYF